MRVVLLKDIKGTGKAGEIKEIADGFAFNSLIPSGKARPAVASDLNRKHQKSYVEVKHDKTSSEQKKIKKSLAGKSFNFFAKADEKGHIYGSVNSTTIAQEISRQGYDVQPDQVQVEPIKIVGTHKALIDFGSLGSISIPIIVNKN